MFVTELIQAFKKARGLWNKSGPGFNGLWAYAVRAWHWARAHGLGPRPVPAQCFRPLNRAGMGSNQRVVSGSYTLSSGPAWASCLRACIDYRHMNAWPLGSNSLNLHHDFVKFLGMEPCRASWKIRPGLFLALGLWCKGPALSPWPVPALPSKMGIEPTSQWLVISIII